VKKTRGPIIYPAAFSLFWDNVTSPRSKGLKSEALERWVQQGRPDAHALIAKWKEYLASLGDLSPKDVCRWIARRGFDEEYTRAVPRATDTRCAWHKRQGTDDKPAFRPDAACDRCRHFTARAGTRTSEPTAGPLPKWAEVTPAVWTEEQRAEAAQLRARQKANGS
jgi:hypothetical protein